MTNTIKVDPITVEVLSNAFMSCAEQMGGTLVKTSYSSNIKERKDCSCAIFNAKGDTIAQAEHIPVHLGSMLGIVEKIKEKFPLDKIKPGDMFIANDPYNGGGTHLPDIAVAMPVFFEKEIVAFVANIAHHSDVGGATPGSISGQAKSIFAEGLRLPPVKFMSEGVICQDILDIILLNCRTEFERTGDLLAQISSNLTGAERIVGIMQKYGRDTVLAGMEELLNYGERKMRMGIRAMPDGEYSFVDYMDDDGINLGVPLPIKVKVIIKGDSVHIDFTGTAAQAAGSINVVGNALRATVYYALKAIIDPTLPPNGGFYRPISIYAPEGTLVNPKDTAACGCRTDACQRIADVIFGAMAQIVPKSVMAGCNSHVMGAFFSGFDVRRNKFFVYPETCGGGLGARYNKDGLDGVHVHITNSSNLPVECLETEYPILVESYSIRNDSGGAGKYRGGLGYRKDYRMMQETEFSSKGDRQKFAPWGLFGGQDGATARLVISPDTDREEVMPSGRMTGVLFKEGDILSVQTAGSGGYGNPFERDIKAVLDDVLQEKVSIKNAEQLYGVVINPDTKEIDFAATEALRKSSNIAQS